MAYALPAITAISAVVGAGAAVNSGVQQGRAAKKSLSRQKDAQQAASVAGMRQDQANLEDQKRVNRKQPNVAALLANAQKMSGASPRTMLTGANGVPTSSLLGG